MGILWTTIRNYRQFLEILIVPFYKGTYGYTAGNYYYTIGNYLYTTRNRKNMYINLPIVPFYKDTIRIQIR